MRFFDHLRFVLIAIVAALGLVCALLPWVVHSMEDIVERTTRHDVAWSGSNGRDEFFDLMRKLLVHRTEASDDSYAKARLSHDILTSRLTAWRAGAFGTFVSSDPRRQRWLTATEKAVQTIGDLLSQPYNRDRANRMLMLLTDVEASLQMLTRAAYVKSTHDLAETASKIQFVQRIQEGLIALLIIGSFVLVCLLLWQNSALRNSVASESRTSAKNAFMAAHDVLTGLANRSTFSTHLDNLCRNTEGDAHHAVFVIDLDGFKPVNDLLGHAAGDMLLMAVAKRLSAFADAHEGALAARLGGDEFLVAMASLPKADAALEYAQALLQQIRAASSLDEHMVTVDASIGIAVLERGVTTPATLIDHADIALGIAKAVGKGQAIMFEQSMLDGIAARIKLEADLARADICEEFEPHFQPIVDLVTQEVVGCEALARWRRHDGSYVPPGQFIPIAETSGRIIDIGAVILFKACRAAAAFAKPLTVSVNLSAVQFFRVDVLKLVTQTLATTGLPPSRLKLEITESMMITDTRQVKQLVEALKATGVTVSLDDFGTGYSSLSYLRNLGFDELKIDRSFVSEITSGGRPMAIAQTIVQLARNLDMTTVAEGIETEEQGRLLLAMGCRRGQGWLFGRPVGEDEFIRLYTPPSKLALTG